MREGPVKKFGASVNDTKMTKFELVHIAILANYSYFGVWKSRKVNGSMTEGCKINKWLFRVLKNFGRRI